MVVAETLDPRNKGVFHKTPSREYPDGERSFVMEKYYDEYRVDGEGSDDGAASTAATLPMKRKLGHILMAQLQSSHTTVQGDELQRYLKDPPAPVKADILDWWKGNESSYPTLATMARDFLAIPGSSVPSEQIFSSGKHTVTSLRNR